MSAGERSFPWWIPIGGLLIAALYAPTLQTKFDFIDDGNLVYPSAHMPLAARAGVVWGKIKANVEHLGPFRPVLWVHWEVEADLFRGNPFVWRSARLVWCALAAGMLLWLLHDLGVSRWAALMAGALSMWNPFRNEIWTSLTLAEGVAMPYALLGLVAAIRAGRAERRWSRLLWDITAVSGVMMALGCKNVFVALIPAQLALRLCPDGWNLREGLRLRGPHAAALLAPIVPFAIHFVYFKLNWHAGQYQPPGPSWGQLVRYLNGLKGAVSLDFVGAGIGLAVVALLLLRSASEVWRKHSTAVVAGGLLLLAGIVIYLPMDGVSGRYTMPAVWGLDVLIAVVLANVITVSTAAWHPMSKLAVGAFVAGLCAVAAANIGRQQKFAARAEMLWQALEWTERQPLPPGTVVAWVSDTAASTGGKVAYAAPTAGLNIEEGIHFDWHLRARHRASRVVRLLDESGRGQDRVEIPDSGDALPAVLFTAFDAPPSGAGLGWEKQQTFEGAYWAGKKRYRCSAWVRGTAAAVQAGATAPRSH